MVSLREFLACCIAGFGPRRGFSIFYSLLFYLSPFGEQDSFPFFFLSVSSLLLAWLSVPFLLEENRTLSLCLETRERWTLRLHLFHLWYT